MVKKQDAPVTKNDVQEIVTKVVTDVTSGVAKEILGAMSTEFTEVKKDIKVLKEDVKNLKATTNRIENKLDATIDKVDDHTVRIKKLEKQPD